MITARQVRERLAKVPFVPFRICLSDGTHHDVAHPEFGWVIGPRIFVGSPGRDRLGWDTEVRELSDLHITRIEPLQAAARKSRK